MLDRQSAERPVPSLAPPSAAVRNATGARYDGRRNMTGGKDHASGALRRHRRPRAFMRDAQPSDR